MNKFLSIISVLIVAYFIISGADISSLPASPDTSTVPVAASSTQTANLYQAVDSAVTSSPTSTSTYLVTQVVDGDTIKIQIGNKIETVRLIGLDTPETVDPRKPVQCFGKEASNKGKELLSGRMVRIEIDPTQGKRDKYDRMLAYVFRDDGLFYNKFMIENGYAHEYTYNVPHRYQAEFIAAEKSAEAAGLGLWNPSACAEYSA